jgi:hypothetical protein
MKGTGYPLHSPVSPSLPLPRVTVYYHISTGVYLPPTINTLSEPVMIVEDTIVVISSIILMIAVQHQT